MKPQHAVASHNISRAKRASLKDDDATKTLLRNQLDSDLVDGTPPAFTAVTRTTAEPLEWLGHPAAERSHPLTRATIQQQDNALNSLNREGKVLEGLDQFYADDCTFQEGNEEPIRGKATQRDRLSKMFATMKSSNGASLHTQAIGDGVSVTEWTFDMTSGDGEPIVWHEVLVRHWNDGKVVRERFYKA